MKHEDAMGQGFFQEGNIEIVKSACAVHQFPPNSKTGEQSDPFTAVRWSFKRLGEDWSPVDGGDEMEIINIRLGNLDNIRPGNLDNPDDLDSEPEDLGRETDTEGNSVYGEAGAKVFGSWGAMEESLRKCNFKPAVIERVYMPDFEGMKCHLKTVLSGRKYAARDGTQKDELFLICDKIQTYPYDKKASKGKSAAKAGAKVESKTPYGDVLEVLKTAISDPQSEGLKKVAKSGTTVKRAVFQMQTQMELIKRKADKDTVSAALAVLKDDDQVAALGADVGFVVDTDAGMVTFP
jgi:hypothetical protein